MATAEELWGARSADAKAFADSLVSRRKPVTAKKTKSVDLGSLGTSTFGEMDEANKKEWFETPVVKGIIDALSVGTYTGMANANQAVEAVRSAQEADNPIEAVGNYIGTGLDQLVNHNPLVMGVKAGFGGDDDSRRLGHDVVKNIHSATQGEEFSNSEEAKKIQGGVGLAMDIAGDPLWAVPGVVPAKMLGGAIRGANTGAKAAKDIANGGEALGRTVGRYAGMKQGAKDGLAAAKKERADDLAFRIAKRDINLKGVSPTSVRENIPGFDFLPEDVIAGTARLTNKDARKASQSSQKASKAMESDTITEVQKLADTEEFTHVRSPEEIASSVVRANTDLFSGKISIGKHNAIIRTMKGTAKTFGHNYDEIVEDYLVKSGLKIPTVAKAADESVPAAAKAEEIPASVGESPVKIGEEVSPQAAKAQEVKARLENPESITPAYPYVDNPGAVDPAEFIRDTPVDEFVKGTAHLSAEVPRIGKKSQKQIQEYLQTHPNASKKVIQERVLDGKKIEDFLRSGRLRQSAKNPDSTIGAVRTKDPLSGKEIWLERGQLADKIAEAAKRQEGGVKAYLNGTAELDYKATLQAMKDSGETTFRVPLSDARKKDFTFEEVEYALSKNNFTTDMFARAIDRKYQRFMPPSEAGAKDLVARATTGVLQRIHPDDLAKLIKAVKDSTVTPEVVEYAWNGAKPGIKQLRDLGFKGDLRESMKTIREFGANLDSLARKSGAFRDILEAYRAGKLPVEDMARFEEFASSFFKLTGEDRLNKDKILEMASDFLRENSAQIMASSLLHAPTGQGGRLGVVAKGQTVPVSDAPGLLRILPPERVQTYSRPFRETERIEIVSAMAQKAEADILNGISPEVVGKIADNLIEKHFTEYATPAGDFITRGGWRTSTTNLVDGMPKKEFFWTTHSAIDLFTKLNTDVVKFMKNIPELDEIRALAKSSKATAAQRKNYEIAYRNVKDNLAMRALAHVDTQLKAHNVFGYLTNVMPHGDTAIRLSLYDVLNAMGPQIRQKHLWVPAGDINNIRPTQLMNVAEGLMRALKGADATGEIDLKQMLKNSQEILKGNFSKNADAKGIVRFIEKNLDEGDRAFNDEIIQKNLKEYPKADVLRKGKYTSLINDVMNRVGDDGFTPMQRLAETTLRNTALHASHFSDKIVYATEEQMKRLKSALEFGTVGNFSDVVASVVRPDRFEPEVSKVFAGEIRGANLQHVSPDELAVASEMANVAKISSGKEMVLYTSKEMEPFLKKTPTEKIGAESYIIPVGPKPKTPSNRMKLSSANATEIMLNGRRMLTDGKTASTKWTTKPWTTNAGSALRAEINAANAKVAGRAGNTALHPDMLLETVAKHSDEEMVNFMRVESAHDITRRMFVGQQMFNVRFGKEISYDAVTSGMHLGVALETAFHGAINEYARKYTPEAANQALKDMQSVNANIHELVARGAIDGLDPALVDMAKLTGSVFDSSANNFYVRNGVGPELMNSILQNMTHVPENWRFPTVVNGELITPAQMGEVWKTWTNIENPFKAMAAIHTAMIKASSDISMGARFSNRFGMQHPPVGEAGNWAKIANTKDVDNAFLGVIDKNLFYPKEIIAELPELGKFITASRTFKNEKFQQWVNSYDEFTSALKLTQTVMKPGHHVMSVQGDFFRNRLAGVNGTSHIKDSWRIIRARNAADKGMSELDKYARIKDNSLQISVQSKTSGSGTKLIVGGRQIILDDSNMYDMFTQRGIFLPPHLGGVAEDLLAASHMNDFANLPGGRIANAVTKASSKTNNFVSGLVNNKVIKLNSFTSQRDNLFRGELAIHAMKSKNFKSIEEALDFAEAKVRKWAPVAKDLTVMESKYNRRVFLYYTWIRGMIPRVVEGLVSKPGIALAPNKAMYNIAIANGLSPQSIGDPFDPNQLMPDYYTNGILGPSWQDPNTGHLWGANPTAPVIDVFNSIGAGTTVAGLNPFQDNSNGERVGRLLMGMTNPIFRSPIEMSMGTNIGTGAPIQDNGQYLTDMPGPLRYASKVTGHTFNPTLGGFPRRTEAKFRDGMTEDEWWQNAALETFNYNTGAQMKDYTSDSAMKSAEFDEKDRLKKENTDADRMDWWK